MKGLVKHAIEILPGDLPFSLLETMRQIRYPKLRDKSRDQQTVMKALGNPNTVLQGPFKGMKYIPRGYFGSTMPKILGTYELELRDCIQKMCNGNHDVIVDIGAAEGYYAVGMAMKSPASRIIAFEMYKPAHRLIKKLAALNNVGTRIDLRGKCTAPLLNESLANAVNPAVLCDCEGAEDFLLNPQECPALLKSTILVELHWDADTSIFESMRARFAPSHSIEVVDFQRRLPEMLPAHANLTPDQASLAMDEGRAIAKWYFMVPHVRV